VDRHPRILVLLCLSGLLVSLALVGVVRAAERRALLQAATSAFTPRTGEAEWEGDWEFSELGADPSEAGTERVTIPFVGTELALRVRQGDYRGAFYVSVDGAPANLLPREERGAYLMLTSPDRTLRVVTIPVASGLGDGPHKATVVVDRAWDQWPLAGWCVGRSPDTSPYRWASVGLGVLGLGCLGGAAWWGTRGREQGSGCKKRVPNTQYPIPNTRYPNSNIQYPIPGILGRASGILHSVPGLAVFATLVVAAAFYLSPWLPLTVVSGVALAALVILQLDLGLALVAATAPFYLHPRSMFGKAFSMAEILTLLCLLSWGVRWVSKAKGQGQKPKTQNPKARVQRPRFKAQGIEPEAQTSLDLAVLCFVGVAVVSALFAEYRHVALRELRVIVLEPALFYVMLRTSRLDAKGIWRVVDFFVLGATVVAVVGLVQYGLGVNVITAEGGFRRLRSVYGSPNNAALAMGRVLPVLVAVTLFGAARGRRFAYGLATVPVGLAILLSFSAGAFLLGVPLSLLVLSVLAGGVWVRAWLGLAGLATVAAVPLLRTPRFARLLNTRSGSTFFRLQLWRSSWAMFRDHLWLGVGPDNFLYQYRSRYILPAAWQEPDLSHPHDVLLDYGCRLGLFGLVTGLWLQIGFWRLAWPLRHLVDPDRRALAIGLMGSMVSFLAHGLVDASYFVIDLAFAFFLALGVVQWLAGTDAGGRGT
jgi:O-antigen ligase